MAADALRCAQDGNAEYPSTRSQGSGGRAAKACLAAMAVLARCGWTVSLAECRQCSVLRFGGSACARGDSPSSMGSLKGSTPRWKCPHAERTGPGILRITACGSRLNAVGVVSLTEFDECADPPIWGRAPVTGESRDSGCASKLENLERSKSLLLPCFEWWVLQGSNL